jgi:hypothetical protein
MLVEPSGRGFVVAFESAPVGVGSSATTSGIPGVCRLLPVLPFQSLATGVGSKCAMQSDNSRDLSLSFHRLGLPTEWESRRASQAVGVGSSEDVEPFSTVRSANGRRRNNRPFRIEPEGGKVTEHGIESERKVSSHILKAHDSWS